MKHKHRGRIFRDRLRSAYHDGYKQGQENGRYRSVRGMWQTRVHDLSRCTLRATEVAVFEAWAYLGASPVEPAPPEEWVRENLVRMLAHEIAKHVKVEKAEDRPVLTARVALATVEYRSVALPIVPHPRGFAHFNDQGDAVWQAF